MAALAGMVMPYVDPFLQVPVIETQSTDRQKGLSASELSENRIETDSFWDDVDATSKYQLYSRLISIGKIQCFTSCSGYTYISKDVVLGRGRTLGPSSILLPAVYSILTGPG